jgi:hypothetical protein
MNTRSIACGLALACLIAVPAIASDHDDTPLLKEIPRHDARITDLHVFTVGDRLVLSLCTDPTIPPSVTSYAFPEDLHLWINVDTDSAVTFDDGDDLLRFGGTIVRPERIRPDIAFHVSFENGTPRLRTKGLSKAGRESVSFFAGLRDDPFIRGPRIGRNSAAIVIELPLAHALEDQSTVLVWARSRVPDVRGPIADLGARSLRSQLAPNLDLNRFEPRQHVKKLGLAPDVVIYDTARPAKFPNGRALTDDVVDTVGDLGVLGTDSPFPTTNDVPFLDVFPYLAEPHQP